jgi:hypothetical protein
MLALWSQRAIFYNIQHRRVTERHGLRGQLWIRLTTLFISRRNNKSFRHAILHFAGWANTTIYTTRHHNWRSNLYVRVASKSCKKMWRSLSTPTWMRQKQTKYASRRKLRDEIKAKICVLLFSLTTFIFSSLYKSLKIKTGLKCSRSRVELYSFLTPALHGNEQFLYFWRRNLRHPPMWGWDRLQPVRMLCIGQNTLSSAVNRTTISRTRISLLFNGYCDSPGVKRLGSEDEH